MALFASVSSSGSVVGRAVVELVGNRSKLSSEFAAARREGQTFVQSLDARLKALGGSMSRVGTTLTRSITVPVLAAGAAATKLALDYEDAFTRIDAVSNASAKSIEKWRGQVEQLAVTTARDPRELAEALYFLASAGLKTSEIMPALEASAKGAAVGLGETQDIARLTANVLNAYPNIVGGAAGAIDTLVAAVKAGTAEPSEFADAMGRILPIAAKAQVEFDEIAASLAGLSNIGLDVNEGVTAMRGLLSAMVAPGSMAAKALKEVGISSDELRATLSEGGLLAAMQLLEERTGGNIDKMREIIPNIRSLTGQLGLTGENAAVVADIFDQVANNTGELDRAFEETERGPMFKFRRALASLKVTAIEFGRELIPIARDVIGVLQGWLQWFRKLDPELRGNIVKWGLLAAALGPVLRLLGRIVSLGGGVVGVITRITRALAGGGAVSAGAGAVGGAATGAAGSALGTALFSVARGAGAAALAAPAGAAAVVELWNAIGPAPDTSGLKYLEGAIEANQVLARITPETAHKLAALMEAFHRYGGFAQASVEFGSKEWAPQINELNRLLEEEGIVANLTGDDIDRLSEGQRVAGLRAKTLAEEVLHSARAQAVWHSIMETSEGATDRQSARIANLVQAYDDWGVSIDYLTFKQAKNLAAVGDIDGAIALLSEHLREDTRSVRENADAWSEAERGLATAERQMQTNAAAARESGDAAEDAGEKAREYGRRVEDIPGNKRTVFSTPGLNEALDQVRQLKAGLMALPAQKRIEIIIAREGHLGGMFHAGGVVGGLSGDEVPAVLQRGEYVINRRSAMKLGKRTLDALNRMHEGGGVGEIKSDYLAVSVTNVPTVKIDEGSIQALADAIAAAVGGGAGGGGIGGTGQSGGGGGGMGIFAGPSNRAIRRNSRRLMLKLRGGWFADVGRRKDLRRMILNENLPPQIMGLLRKSRAGRAILEDGDITGDELRDAIELLIDLGVLGAGTGSNFRAFGSIEQFFRHRLNRPRNEGRGGAIDTTLRDEMQHKDYGLVLPDGEGEGGPRRRRTVQNFFGDFYGFDDFRGKVAEANRRNDLDRMSL